MDEVDGMSGGDRGGVGDLIAVCARGVGGARNGGRGRRGRLSVLRVRADWAAAPSICRASDGVTIPGSKGLRHPANSTPSSLRLPTPPSFCSPPSPSHKPDHQGQQGAHHHHLQRQVLHQAQEPAQPHHRARLPQVSAACCGSSWAHNPAGIVLHDVRLQQPHHRTRPCK